MNKLISANYWFGCDWWFYEVGYLSMRPGQLSLACAGVYLWNTGYLRVTDPRMNSGFQNHRIKVHLVFAVKFDGRHKARLGADGHLTAEPIENIYSGVGCL